MSNEEVISKFEDDCILRDLRERTRETYLRVLHMFVEFSGVEEYASLDEAYLRKWLLHLKKDTNLTNATINQYNSAAKFFLKIVLDQDVNDKQVPNSRLKRKPQPFMTANEIRELFSHFDDFMSFTFFILLYSTGIRRSEALSVTMKDIVAYSKDKGPYYLIVHDGKGGHDRNVELPSATYQLLRKYYMRVFGPVSSMSEEEKMGIRTTPLFPSSIGGVKANTFFTRAFNTARECNTLFKEFHPHTLRHSFAVHMLQKDINNIMRVQANLGHKSLSTTEIYLSNARLYNVEDALSPAELTEELCNEFYKKKGF